MKKQKQPCTCLNTGYAIKCPNTKEVGFCSCSKGKAMEEDLDRRYALTLMEWKDYGRS